MTKLDNDGALTSSNIITNIQITIDTDKLIKNYPNPSKDSGNPTGISHDYQFMVASNVTAIGGQGTGDLTFAASVGDVVRIYGTSEYNNMDNPVLVYNIAKFGGTTVFGPFISQKFAKTAVQPADSSVVLPPVYKVMDFWFYETNIQNVGTENFTVSFALYTRVRGQANPVLFGYFYWDPTVVVKD